MPSSTTVTAAYVPRPPSDPCAETCATSSLPPVSPHVTSAATCTSSALSRVATLTGTTPQARFAACRWPDVADCTTLSATSTPGASSALTGSSSISAVAFVSAMTRE